MESTALVQGATVFSDRVLDVSRCSQYVCELLRALGLGQTFDSQGLQNIFFSLTKGFSSKDPWLKRVMCGALRRLQASKDYTFVVQQALTNLIAGNSKYEKADAVRLVNVLLPSGVAGDVGKVVKQMIVGKDALVAIGGLCCALGYALGGVDEVRKWVQELVKASEQGEMQGIALLVLFRIRLGDVNLLGKMVSGKGEGATPFASHVLVRIAAASGSDEGRKFISGMLKAGATATTLDAVRAVLEDPKATQEQLNLAAARLGTLLSSASSVTQFAVLRLIRRHAATRSEVFAHCDVGVERVLNLANPTTSASAAIALLLVAREGVVDRAVSGAGKFAASLDPETLQCLLDAVVGVVQRFPTKLQSVLELMWTLRGADDLEVQRVFVRSLILIAQKTEGAAIASGGVDVLANLCEYLEDSRFCSLSLEIIRYISGIGPAAFKGEVLRCLAMRLLLDAPEIRAAAIEAVWAFSRHAEFAGAAEVLIENCLSDPNDHVRGQAVLYNAALKEKWGSLPVLKTAEAFVSIAPAPAATASHPLERLGFGRVVCEGPATAATEADADLAVTYTASVFAERVVFDFAVRSNVDRALRNVRVQIGREAQVLQCDEVPPHGNGHVSLIISREGRFAIVRQGCSLIFSDAGMGEEQFDLDEDVELLASAYLRPLSVPNFADSFAHMGAARTQNVLMQRLRGAEQVFEHLARVTGMGELTALRGKDARKVTGRFAGATVASGGREGPRFVALMEVEAGAAKDGGMAVRLTAKAEDPALLDAVMRSAVPD